MKKRISILLVVAMLVSSLLTFTVATAETAPEVLIYGGPNFSTEGTDVVYFDATKAGTKTLTGSENILPIHVAIKNMKGLGFVAGVLKYDTTVLEPASYSEEYSQWASASMFEGIGLTCAPVTTPTIYTAGFGQTSGNEPTSTSGITVQASGCKTANGLVYFYISNTASYVGKDTTKYTNVATITFTYKDGKTAANLKEDTITVASNAEAQLVTEMAENEVTPQFQFGEQSTDDGSGNIIEGTTYNYGAATNALPCSFAYTEKAEEPSTEPSTEPSSEPSSEPTTAPTPEAPKSSNANLSASEKFFTSGVKKSTIVKKDGKNYTADIIDGYKLYVIGARKAHAGATVKSAIITEADLANLAAVDYNDQWYVQIPAASIKNGQTAYAAFEITAEDGVTKAYYTMTLYNPIQDMTSLWVSALIHDGIEADIHEYEIVKLKGYKNLVLAARTKDKYNELNFTYKLGKAGAVYADAEDFDSYDAPTYSGSIKASRVKTGDILYVCISAKANPDEKTIYSFKVVDSFSE